jgi:hypothetical protein
VTGGAGGQAIPNAVTGVPLQTNFGLQTSVVPQGIPALTAQAQNAAYSQHDRGARSRRQVEAPGQASMTLIDWAP